MSHTQIPPLEVEGSAHCGEDHVPVLTAISLHDLNSMCGMSFFPPREVPTNLPLVFGHWSKISAFLNSIKKKEAHEFGEHF